MEGGDDGEQREEIEESDAVFVGRQVLCLIKDGIADYSSEGLGEHGIERL